MGRFLRTALPAAAALLLIAASVIWWTMHTDWFMKLVRARIIAVAERATGGRVELGAFSYDTDKATAELHNFVIHGNEPTGAPPLLRIHSLQVGFKILSFWRRDIDLQSLVVDRPEIHLLAANGRTNMPAPRFSKTRQDPIQQLLDLKIARVEILNGLFVVNDNSLPLDLTTDHLALNLAYNISGPSYDVLLSLPSTNLKFRALHPRPIDLATQAHLFTNSIRFDALHLALGHSNINASGSLEHFDRPSANFSLDTTLAVDDLAELGRIAQLQNGTATAKGDLHFDGATSGFTFTGRAQARNVNYISRSFTLKGMNAEGDIVANNDGMSIKRATASARGAHFAGDALIKRYRFLQVQGQVSQVSLREVGTYLTDQPFPWSGTAAGSAFASATFLQPDPNFIIGAQVQITPEPGSVATSGQLGVTYHDHSGEVRFSNVHLTLPHSQVIADGNLSETLETTVDSGNLADLTPILPIIEAHVQQSDLPVLKPNGHVHFSGTLRSLMGSPLIQGNLSASNVSVLGQIISLVDSQFSLSTSSLQASSFKLREPIGSLSGSLSVGLVNWAMTDGEPIQLKASFSDLDVVKAAALLSSAPLPVINGIASGALSLGGSLAEPSGNARLRIANLNAYGEQINQITLDATLAGSTLKVAQGRVQAGQALLSFSGDFRRANNNWSTGDLHLRADTNGFPLASLSTVHNYAPTLTAQAEAHFDALLRVTPGGISPLRADGTAFLRRVAIDKTPYGEATLKAVTQGASLDLTYSGKLLQTEWDGKAQAKLVAGSPIRGNLELGRLDFASLRSLVPTLGGGLILNGFLQGGLQFQGSLEKLEQMQANLSINHLEVSSPVRLGSVAPTSRTQILLRNKSPIQIEAANGVATVRSFEITGNETSIDVTGSAPFIGKQPLNIKAVGKANLQIFSLFDPNVQSSGASEVAVNIAGSLTAPTVTGALQVTNGTFFLAGLPNGLSAVNGTVVFNRNRATIQKMVGRTGGGDLSLSGFVNFGAGSPLVYHLEGVAQNVRVRYANSISVTANSDLRLSGTSTSSILSGNLTVTRVVFTPNADVGNLLAAAGASASASGDEGDFLTGLHLDVVVESAPNLQLSTNLSRDVEAEIQLRLRGTPEHPILLGSISANQGDLRVFGTRYTLNRGEVNFVNTVKAEPVLDLDLETQTRGVTVDITISGTASKLNFNYRSDPPLQPRDIIALLTVGRTPGVGTTSNAQGASDASALSSGVNSVLGQAIAPVSNRLSRLFGITNIRIDPFVQGITNTPQARLSVEQQISRDITITYVTNLSQTSEQIFRLEWALNRQYSIVAIRDDNGEFGIDFQYKKRFK